MQTEDLELNHYIELREEYDRVQQQLMTFHNLRSSTTNPVRIHDCIAEETITLRGTWQSLRQFLRHPGLVRQYQNLLVQVRFHELRIHFIRANKLPLKFKISDYLRKCEQQVLMRFISISSFAWLVMMAAANLAYFAMSMVVLCTNSLSATENAMLILFFAACILFIVVTVMILGKVKWIFSQIMQ